MVIIVYCTNEMKTTWCGLRNHALVEMQTWVQENSFSEDTIGTHLKRIKFLSFYCLKKGIFSCRFASSRDPKIQGFHIAPNSLSKTWGDTHNAITFKRLMGIVEHAPHHHQLEKKSVNFSVYTFFPSPPLSFQFMQGERQNFEVVVALVLKISKSVASHILITTNSGLQQVQQSQHTPRKYVCQSDIVILNISPMVFHNSCASCVYAVPMLKDMFTQVVKLIIEIHGNEKVS